MEMKFVNDSGSAVWFVYYGLDPADDRKPVHLADRTGRLARNVPSSTPTDTLAISVADSESFVLPMLTANRLYISLEKPLSFVVSEDGHPLPPMSADPKDPNYGTPWDFFEGTYMHQADPHSPGKERELFNFNLSNVQSANLSLRFHIEGTEPSSGIPVDYTRGWVAGGYETFLKAIRANADFAGLILPDTDRVLGPGTAIIAFQQKVIPQPVFDAEYLKAYVEEVWAKFAATELTFVADPPEGSSHDVNWTGQVADGRFTFTADQPGLQLEPIVLNPPTTEDLFENNINNFLVSGGGEPRSVQRNQADQLLATLCAAFNRSVMLTTTTLGNAPHSAWCKATETFYQDSTTNHYSKEVHANAEERLAYAFQSDDHCNRSNFVSVVNPGPLTISIGART